MNQLRLWIALLAATCFLAGLGGGVLLAFELRPTPPVRGPFADYEILLASQFELERSPLRMDGLRAVLASYHAEVEELRSRHMALLEPELRQLGDTCRARIRNRVLPPDRRDEFDRLAAGLAAPLPLD